MRLRTLAVGSVLLVLGILVTGCAEDSPDKKDAGATIAPVEIDPKILDKHFGAALEEAVNAVLTQFEIRDTMESQLFAEAMQGKTQGQLSSHSIIIFRPDQKKESRETYEFRNRGQQPPPVIRWTRVRTPNVSTPIGIVAYSEVGNEGMIIEEKFYHYSEDQGWTRTVQK
ncbi:hypothetical protein Pan258_16770 [Symmachiella dynata]|uniref:hypothetical protein n=1 Tax=Symmachiella dynata TaxID=2527995 RepID=UPI00118920EB|nr:hypothetical protein [Symmachiella dynata]QDT47641.1 hypothetical protein Pan258_16770 [Symmachiella dynata]